MRIAELSRRSGVSVPTIKFYLREGLLAAGAHTSRNQSTYDETHERRLRLVRALIEVGGLSIAAVRRLLTAADVHTMLSEMQVVTVPPGTDDGTRNWADAAVAQLIARRGWRIRVDHPSARALAGVLVTAAQLGRKDFLALIDKYAVACADFAGVEIRSFGGFAEEMVVGTVLGDAAITALRRMAQGDALQESNLEVAGSA
ncbi:MerR family transcriptional regulator [Actinocrispum wychmicini]|uniref:MerR-like DNA binding protein n=1 Tax=Actinocrispum wychmicini TaxID=1213861 RepID=A0A4R2ISG0_9PSEU|nr:MerR family transcriptional regulator [Actinocrispum wychmicini]TCO47416.1 MerR-like DNA binding protein [Actinocrispum wychmicini]